MTCHGKENDIDLLITQALSNRCRYKALKNTVPTGMISPETQAILAWIGCYWDAFPDREDVEIDELISLIKVRSSQAPPENVALAVHLAERMRLPVDSGAIRGIVGQLHELDLAGRAGAILTKYNNGDEVSLAYELQMMAAAARRSMSEGNAPNWAHRSIHELLQEDSDDGGLQWSVFPQLAQALKGLHKGNNIALCAPTDQGKSSLLCKLAVCFQSQAHTLYPGQKTLYLVNEGTADNIQRRLYQTVLQQTREGMLAQSNAELEAAYCAVVGARDGIKAINIHGKNVAQVTGIIEAEKPHLVITDMTGRIRSMSNTSGGANDVQQLESTWNDFRELAVIHNFAHLGTVQVSVEGENMLYPPRTALQMSKTGIQTTLDLLVMLGALTNPAARGLRGISTPKNKLARSGQESYTQFECYFDGKLNTWNCGADSTAAVPPNQG